MDLAALTGGNCDYTKAGEIVVTENQVKVIGYTDFPSRLPTQSSQLYGTNLVNLLKLLCKEKDGNIHIDFEDVVLRGVTVIRDGEITCRLRRFKFLHNRNKKQPHLLRIKKKKRRRTLK